MNYTQHPLSAAFPAMNAEELAMRLDGTIPSSQSFIESIISSTWFQSLTKSQRAAYVIGWFNQCAVGSNQHKRIASTKTQRFSAEKAKSVIAGASA